MHARKRGRGIVKKYEVDFGICHVPLPRISVHTVQTRAQVTDVQRKAVCSRRLRPPECLAHVQTPMMHVGDKLQVNGHACEVIDTSDPALVTLKTGSGAPFKIGRLRLADFLRDPTTSRRRQP